MKRRAIFAAIGVASVSAACASILGIEDGVLDTTLGADAGPQICLSDSGVQPDQNQVFVATIGLDNSSCGSLESPCKTIGQAITTLPKTRGANIIYVADGLYPETVTLPANVEIQGGWHVRSDGQLNLVWSQICPDALTSQDSLPNIVGTENITIHAATANAKLSHVVVKTKTAGPGESLYGIFASGSTTTVTLNGVIVVVNPAGDGISGKPGAPGALGDAGACPEGTGTTPALGAAGAGAAIGAFGPTGVSLENAGGGASGARGENGVAGDAGSCVTCYDCQVEIGACNQQAGSCGAVGHSGCGGFGGGGGEPGSSGGSAIGIYAWGGAVIDLGGEVDVGNGGAGGAGGPGGNGGEGGVGSMGDAGPTCSTACSSLVVCTSTVASMGAGPGGIGSRGGFGATGGMGGGGAGGYSYAIVAGLDASVFVDGGALLKPGQGGTGGSAGGANGNYGARFP